MPYEEDLPRRLPPPWRDTFGAAFARAVGRRMDSIVQLFREAVFARLPGLASSGSLPHIAEERLIDRGPTETDADFALRLRAAWDAWEGDHTPFTGKGGGAGSHRSMLLAMQGIGLPMGPTGAHIVQQNGLSAYLDASQNVVVGTLMNCVNRTNLLGAIDPRPGWGFDGRDNFYSIFGIVFPSNVAALRAGTDTAAALGRVVDRWRPSKALYMGAWVIESGRTLGWPATGRTLGTEPALGGNVVHFVPGPRRHDIELGYHLP